MMLKQMKLFTKSNLQLIKYQKNVLGKKPTKPDRGWITLETLAQIQQKHKIRKQFGSKSVEYKLAKSIHKQLCRTDKQKHIDKIHLEIIEKIIEKMEKHK